jgi:hypothetical protein
MAPVPTEIYLPDWHAKFKKDNPNRKPPSYFDLALGVKGEGLPSQDLNDEYIRHLLREGNKDGGVVDIDAADARLSAAIEKRMAKGGSVDIEAADARLEAAINARMEMAEGGATGFKKIEFMADGGKLVKGLSNIGKKLFADSKVLPQAEREANLQKFLAPSAEKRRMYHGSKEPNITEFKTRKDLTNEDNMTGHYADERDAVFLSPEPEFSKDFSVWGYTDEGKAPTTYPVYAQVERPFDFDNPEHLQKVKATYLDMFHNPESEFYDPHITSSERSMDLHRFNQKVDDLPKDENNWGRIENQQFQEVLKDLGFDSFYTRERGTKNLGIYDPNRIKSAIGNRGTYDLGESDINKADGGKLVKGASKVMKKLMAPQDDALKLAQERAALPVSQGGLGLPANNTPEQRAKAMGFNTEGFHGTDAVKDFKKFKTSPNDETGIKGVSFALDPKETDAYVTGRWTHEGYGGRVIPVMVRGNAPEEYLNLFEQVINNAKTYPETNMGQDRMLKKALKDSDSIGIDYSKSIGGTEFSVLEPDRIRSRFAAFDPFRKSAAIAASMGVAAPDLLAKEKEKKKADGGKIVGGLGKIAKKLLEEPKIQTIEAPSIIIPSKLSNVKEAARKREGDYGARRVERASDEIPNLEKMYQEDALRSAFIGDNARALMTMNPADFEKYASPVVQRARHWGSKGQSDPDKANLPTEEYIKYLRTVGPFDEVPFLEINKQEQGLPLIPFISGHEGRHRNRALASAGEDTGLVQLLPRAELREPFPRRSQEEYIEALKKELEMTNNLVDPQEFWSPDVFAKKPRIRLPTTKLPDLYAEGGAAFKTLQFKDAQHFDGGGIAFPEMTPMTEGSRREPLLTEKDWENIKRNAPEVYEWAKQNVKDEASQLKSARGVKDFALRTGAQYLGGIPDLLNLGLMGVDALADTNLSSEKPYFGSERYIDAMRKVGMVGENEFPIAETVAGVLMPAGLIKKGIKKISGAKPAKQEPKKRQGGLSAMAR